MVNDIYLMKFILKSSDTVRVALTNLIHTIKEKHKNLKKKHTIKTAKTTISFSCLL